MSEPTHPAFLTAGDDMDMSSQHGGNVSDIEIDIESVQDNQHDEFMTEANQEHDDEPMNEAGNEDQELEDRLMDDDFEITYEDEDQELRDASREHTADHELLDVPHSEVITGAAVATEPVSDVSASEQSLSVPAVIETTSTALEFVEESQAPLASTTSGQLHTSLEASALIQSASSIETTHGANPEESSGETTPKAHPEPESEPQTHTQEAQEVGSSHNDFTGAHQNFKEVEEPYDPSESHPITIEWQGQRYRLFPSNDDDGAEEAILNDKLYLHVGIPQIFKSLRGWLGNNVGAGEDLELYFDGLRLALHEEFTIAKCASSLADLLRIYVSMAYNDNIEYPEPMLVYLTARKSFQQQIEELQKWASQGKGLSFLIPEDELITEEEEVDGETYEQGDTDALESGHTAQPELLANEPSEEHGESQEESHEDKSVVFAPDAETFSDVTHQSADDAKTAAAISDAKGEPQSQEFTVIQAASMASKLGEDNSSAAGGTSRKVVSVSSSQPDSRPAINGANATGAVKKPARPDDKGGAKLDMSSYGDSDGESEASKVVQPLIVPDVAPPPEQEDEEDVIDYDDEDEGGVGDDKGTEAPVEHRSVAGQAAEIGQVNTDVLQDYDGENFEIDTTLDDGADENTSAGHAATSAPDNNAAGPSNDSSEATEASAKLQKEGVKTLLDLEIPVKSLTKSEASKHYDEDYIDYSEDEEESFQTPVSAQAPVPTSTSAATSSATPRKRSLAEFGSLEAREDGEVKKQKS